MHLFSPNHVQLLNSCYPPTSALLAAGPDHLPNSQELSRLTYYASNHPGKLTKLGAELEKRIKTESRKAKAGNLRTRVSLLMSLSIFRALAIECRRDIALLSPSLMSSVNETLAAVPTDLEVIVRAAGAFTAWTTYTDGKLIGIDCSTSRDYLSVLQHFSLLSCSTVSDQEVRNRTRLIGFAALTGALNSDALSHDPSQFRAQVSKMMHPILITLFQTELVMLDEQAAAVKDAPWYPYLAEFRTRPTIERRAASIHIHVDGDKGPSMEDVSNATLRALFSLITHANGLQIGFIMHSSFTALDELQGWDDLDHCCWFARKMAEWSQYQYRFAVPTLLVEQLCKTEDTLIPTPMHSGLAAMATTVFDSSIALVNLSTSNMISTLTTLLLRRAEANPNDSLLPALIQCISSLGRHVYYSDQIQDLAGELINRLVIVEAQSALSRGKSDRNTTQAIRSLLAALLGLIKAADKNESIVNEGGSPSQLPSTETSRKDFPLNIRASRRTSVPPDMWQDTLSLICDNDHAIRADYTDTLIFYLREEMSKQGESADFDGAKYVRRLDEGPTQQAVSISILLHPGNSGTKFIRALHGYLYILATASSLGLLTSSSTSPSHSTLDEPTQTNVIPPASEDRDLASPAHSQASGRRSFSTPQVALRKASAVKRLLDQTPTLSTSTSISACLADYTLILNVLTAIHEEFPIRGLLTGVPMLLALDRATRILDLNDVTLQRIHAIREVLAKVWLVLGTTWSSPELVQMAETALSSGPNILPTILPFRLSTHLPPRTIVDFPQTSSATAPWAGVSVEEALAALVTSPCVHEATGLDQQALFRRMSTKWGASIVVGESMERSSTFENTIRGDGVGPLLKISPALMHMENISQQSLARSVRGVGVADLRGALEGRNSTSNLALGRPPSISTLDYAPSMEGGNIRLVQTRSRTKKRSTPPRPGEVRDVLHKLGIGSQNGSLLKASFPSLQKSDRRVPPYK